MDTHILQTQDNCLPSWFPPWRSKYQMMLRSQGDRRRDRYEDAMANESKNGHKCYRFKITDFFHDFLLGSVNTMWFWDVKGGIKLFGQNQIQTLTFMYYWRGLIHFFLEQPNELKFKREKLEKMEGRKNLIKRSHILGFKVTGFLLDSPPETKDKTKTSTRSHKEAAAASLPSWLVNHLTSPFVLHIHL